MASVNAGTSRSPEVKISKEKKKSIRVCKKIIQSKGGEKGSLTGPAEGDGFGIEAGSNGRRKLDVEDEEVAMRLGRVGSR